MEEPLPSLHKALGLVPSSTQIVYKIYSHPEKASLLSGSFHPPYNTSQTYQVSRAVPRGTNSLFVLQAFCGMSLGAAGPDLYDKKCMFTLEPLNALSIPR